MTHDWASPEYVEHWLRHDTQTELLRLPMEIAAALAGEIPVTRVIDLGSGSGRFLDRLLRAFPTADGMWVDSSDRMAEVAREELAPLGDRVRFVLGDASRPEDLDLGPADIVATSRMVHHFAPEQIRRIYRWAANALGGRGYFFNLDHYGSPPGWETRYRAIRPTIFGGAARQPDGHAHDHPFSPLTEHLEWMRAAGFDSSDIAWKAFYTALLVGRIGEAPVE
ncbi:MAG TPA: methyltransferase domain-containing protein [Acidimicrobiia bacterium]|nr:methyltransferase domain-containing protein [Acidimicrobiia bacterium]